MLYIYHVMGYLSSAPEGRLSKELANRLHILKKAWQRFP